MKYVNADHALPQHLLREVQKYIQGGLLYIPKPEGQHTRWGEKSGGRSYLAARNHSIRERYASGISVAGLAEEFCLSCDSIKKIVYGRKQA
ncbi:CD3324 family protein [Paenibacillus sp. MMS20-IR301]|uniref:CD3324 family protein n=1 Tax=Paenibacillus sp. MMS20-IR301 TaxID=2895946 RepID=UPI0028E626B9|nr:CD3324 family protein [Paenibacillus sp. MMS20-IR301]WNS46923.1 CD3324 family protein [Paenibacillus sp. MMS20-IR301]